MVGLRSSEALITSPRAACAGEAGSASSLHLNEELAKIYGVEGITGSHYRPHVFAEGPRAGLLTTPGFLALNAPCRTLPRSSLRPSHQAGSGRAMAVGGSGRAPARLSLPG